MELADGARRRVDRGLLTSGERRANGLKGSDVGEKADVGLARERLPLCCC